MLEHMENLLQIPGSKLLFGGKPLKNHSIPSIYGALEPTAVYVPIEEILKDSKTYELVTKEIFGPFQVKPHYINFIFYLHDLCGSYLTEILNDVSESDIQIVTEYKKDQLPLVLDALERMHAHLTAAVVSNDPIFIQVKPFTIIIIILFSLPHIDVINLCRK